MVLSWTALLLVVFATAVNGIVIRPSAGDKPVSPGPPSEQDDNPLRLLTNECLECICQSVSSCSQNVRCRKEGAVFCGPYFISRTYWNEAGRPGHSEDSPGRNITLDFVECANERFCSDETVRGYMKRYATDCNGDGVVTCMDFALIHKNGPSGCKNPSNRAGTYYSRFQECFEKVQKTDVGSRSYYSIIPR